MNDVASMLDLLLWKCSNMKRGAKGTLYPRSCHEGAGGSRCIALFFLSLTSAIDEGGWSTPRHSRFALPIVMEAGWAPGSVWTGAEYLAPNRDLFPRWCSSYRMLVQITLFRPARIRKSVQFNLTFDDFISELNKH